MTVGLYCSINTHTKCHTARCTCACHKTGTPPQPSPTPEPVKLLAYYCRAGLHPKCPARGELCKCPCHKPQPIEERIVTDHIAEAARVLQTRIEEIDDELGQYADLRTERKNLEAALRKLRPTTKKAKSNGTATGPSLRERVLTVVASEPNSDWTITDILAQVELSDWTTDGDPKQQVSTACSQLASAGQLERVGRGIYKAVAT